MSGFLLVSRGSDETCTERAAEIHEHARAHGLTPVHLTRSTWVADLGPLPAAIVSAGAWRLIGRVHDRRKPPVDQVSDHDPEAFEKKLLARFWGAYVGVRFHSDGQLAAILRDPSGALDCAVWRDGDLTIVASDFPDWLVALQRPPWRIDFSSVHAAMIDPALAADGLMLSGPVAISPGTLRHQPSGNCTVLWRPDWIARVGAANPVDDATAARRLVAAVDEVVAGLAAGPPLAGEVSGGLDSAIVAATLVGQGAAVPLWLSAYGPDPSGDERPFVASLARHLDIAISPVPRSVGVVTQQFLEAMPQRLRPGLSALDGLHDADWAARLRKAHLTAIATGKGGDGLFIQPATGAVFADLWRDQGWRALASPALPALARWTGRSVWSLLKEAGAARRPRPRPKLSGLVRPRGSSDTRPIPDWLTGIEDLGPAKQAQISAVLYGVGLHGSSLQTEVADVLHPLLAQPVVEACLELPAIQLTLGQRDRALARAAFADRLPPEIVARRSKGEMSAFYGRMIAGGLDVLRPWLLDGRLAQEGIIDRRASESLLARESLIGRGGYADIMTAAAFEGWVRAWEARLERAV